MKIEVLGPGCLRCHETEKRVINALTKSGKNADVSHVYDLKELAKRRVMFTPAVAVDGEVKISGKIPTEEEILSLLGPRMT